jgi:hypothetical protein
MGAEENATAAIAAAVGMGEVIVVRMGMNDASTHPHSSSNSSGIFMKLSCFHIFINPAYAAHFQGQRDRHWASWREALMFLSSSRGKLYSFCPCPCPCLTLTKTLSPRAGQKENGKK